MSWLRCGPFFIEDPLRAENAAEFAHLRSQISVPIATGEQLASKWEWQVLVERDLIDYCRVDLCICGGLTESRKIAGWCETHYIEQVPHNPLGPVSTAACLHFDLSTPLFAVQELTWRPGVLDGVVRTDMRLDGGNLVLRRVARLGGGARRGRGPSAALPATGTEHPPPRGRLGLGLVKPPRKAGGVSPIWVPSAERTAASNLSRWCDEHGFGSYDEAWEWSVAPATAGEFWRGMADYCHISWRSPPVADLEPAPERVTGYRWFRDGRLNYAETSPAGAAERARFRGRNRAVRKLARRPS